MRPPPPVRVVWAAAVVALALSGCAGPPAGDAAGGPKETPTEVPPATGAAGLGAPAEPPIAAGTEPGTELGTEPGTGPSPPGKAVAAPLPDAVVPAPLPAAPVPAAPLPAAPSGALAVAEVLVRAERGLRDPSTPPDQLQRLGQEQQDAYRQLVANPDWRPVAREALGDLAPAFDTTLRALDSLTVLNRAQPQLPSWQIVPAPPLAELIALYQDTGAASGIDWTYLAAIHFVETRFSRIRGTSSAGAQGPMQFIPSTWAIYGEGDINDTGDAVRAAARYLVASGAPADMADALYHYNPSQRYVDAISAYASVIRAEPRALAGYYHWRVYYALESGTVLLEEGYGT